MGIINWLIHRKIKKEAETLVAWAAAGTGQGVEEIARSYLILILKRSIHGER